MARRGFYSDETVEAEVYTSSEWHCPECRTSHEIEGRSVKKGERVVCDFCDLSFRIKEVHRLG